MIVDKFLSEIMGWEQAQAAIYSAEEMPLRLLNQKIEAKEREIQRVEKVKQWMGEGVWLKPGFFP